MAETFKYIHASDLHLDQPIRGVAELPPHLKSSLANAPYEAAFRVFDEAIAERVDFVLLSGDLFDPKTSGPRSFAFLIEQFNRLMERKITVYWVAGQVDPPNHLPSGMELPCNVITFSSSDVEVVQHHKNGTPVATIMGAAFAVDRDEFSDFFASPKTPFPIAFTHGEIEPALTEKSNIRYWAMGGRHTSLEKKTTDGWIVYPGTPQGRSVFETGSCGCTLVQVDGEQELRFSKIDTDCIRWLPQIINVSEDTSVDALKNTLAERASKISRDAPQKNALIHWHLLTTGELNPSFRQAARRNALTEWLRTEFGAASHGCLWTTSVSIEPPKQLPGQWFDEDTILGEYLRAIGRFQKDERLGISLQKFLPKQFKHGSFAGMAQLTQERRAEILNESIMIGVDYMATDLSNDQPPPISSPDDPEST